MRVDVGGYVDVAAGVGVDGTLPRCDIGGSAPLEPPTRLEALAPSSPTVGVCAEHGGLTLAGGEIGQLEFGMLRTRIAVSMSPLRTTTFGCAE